MDYQQSSPEIADSPERERLLGLTVLAVAKANFDSGDPTSDMINLTVNRCGTSIMTFTDHTLSRLCDPTLNTHWANTAAKGIFSQWDNQMVSDYLSNAYLLQGDSAMTTIHNLNVVASYLRLLTHYKELAPLGPQHATERAHQAAAILKFTFHVKATGNRELRRAMELNVKGETREWDLPYVNDDRLRALLLSSEYDREKVLDLVIQRNIYNADHIIALLEGISAPLVDGAL